MKKWKHPPVIKIYEALGSVADDRVKIDGNKAQVGSSSGNKFYTVTYDPETQSIMQNDNGSFWKGYLGYPAIALLMKKGVLPYEEGTANLLQGIKWKDLNQRFKNDFDKTLEFILDSKTEPEKEVLKRIVSQIDAKIKELNLNLLGEKIRPPEGY